MSNELREGVELLSVIGVPCSEDGQLHMKTGAGGNCERIVVSMQDGQMAGVPWARCEMNDGRLVLLNLAMMESVSISEREAV